MATPLDIAKQLQTEINQLVDALTPAVPAPQPLVVTVAAGGNLQAAIDAAAPGTTIRVAASATFGSITLRKKAPGDPIVIRSDVDDAQLPVGVRATPAQIGAMFTIAPTPNSNVGIATELGAGPYTIIGAHITSPGVNGTMFAIGDQPLNALADCPHDIVIDRCYFDGGNACHRGISFHGAHLSLIHSTVSGVMKVGQDTQAVGGARGPGPFLIEDNYLSAGSETILFGGDDPTSAELSPADITIRGNYVTKDLAWKAIKGTVKNAIELKNAQRVLIENNIFEYAWKDEQDGFLLMLTVRNQNGSAPWSTIRDVEIRNNVFRHGNQGISILGLDDIKDKTTLLVHPSVRMQNVSIHNNLFYDLGGAQWGGGSGTRAIVVNNGPINVTLDHNTFVGPVGAALGVLPGTSKAVSTGLQITNSVMPEGSWGITGDGTVTFGAPSWTAGVDPTSVFDYNAIQPGASKWTYPGAHTRRAAMTFDGSYNAAPPLTCADGKPAGADIAGVLAAIPNLDLSK